MIYYARFAIYQETEDKLLQFFGKSETWKYFTVYAYRKHGEMTLSVVNPEKSTDF